MMDKSNSIFGFQGQYRFLSNFWMTPVVINAWIFPSSEHAYQASKSEDPSDWRMIQALPTPGQTKRAGRRVNLRPDWEDIKLKCMVQIVWAKFKNSDLRQKLVLTGNKELVEANNWNDRFWGTDMNGNGQNVLGKILMQVREEVIANANS